MARQPPNPPPVAALALIVLLAVSPMALAVNTGAPVQAPISSQALPSAFSWQEAHDLLYDQNHPSQGIFRAFDASELLLDVNEKAILETLSPDARWLVDQQRSNLQLARDVYTFMEQGGGSFAENMELVKFISSWQGVTMAGSAEPLPLHGYELPSQAVAALLARYNTEATPEQWREVLALDEQPDRIRNALARFFDAWMAVEDSVRLAYANVDMGRVAALEATLWLLDEGLIGSATDTLAGTQHPRLALQDLGVDYSAIFPTRNQFLDTVVEVATAFELEEAVEVQFTSGATAIPPVIAFDIRGFDNSFYDENFVLTLDVQGNDIYHNNAGGSNVLSDACWNVSPPVQYQNPVFPIGNSEIGPGVGAAIDLQGNDVYGDPNAPRSCGINGGANVGLGILVDRSGVDTYTAGHKGVNGASHFGVALLFDNSEDDIYIGTDEAVNGGGEFYGVGFLADGSGNDQYTGSRYAINGGAARGLGTLFDQTGNDVYDAFRFGVNGGGYKIGIGLLFDGSENDHYTAGWVATNGGAHHGVGLLVDGSEDDVYDSPYASSNGGASIGLGLLLDGGGIDQYSNGIDRSQAPKGVIGAQMDVPHLPS